MQTDLSFTSISRASHSATASPSPVAVNSSNFTSMNPVLDSNGSSVTAIFSSHIPPAISPTHSGIPPASLAGGGGGMVGYPHQQPLMVYAPYSPVYLYGNSPLPSPLASPKTSSKLQTSGSYMAINRCPAETLLKWLKSLRLHKYHSIFEKMTYEEVRNDLMNKWLKKLII